MKTRKPRTFTRTTPDGLRTLGKAVRYLSRHKEAGGSDAQRRAAALEQLVSAADDMEVDDANPEFDDTMEDPAIEEAIYPEDEPEDFAYSHADLMDRRGRP